jgi:hypothetical protein
MDTRYRADSWLSGGDFIVRGYLAEVGTKELLQFPVNRGVSVIRHARRENDP